jgi:hypothetical protein
MNDTAAHEPTIRIHIDREPYTYSVGDTSTML